MGNSGVSDKIKRAVDEVAEDPETDLADVTSAGESAPPDNQDPDDVAMNSDSTEQEEEVAEWADDNDFR